MGATLLFLWFILSPFFIIYAILRLLSYVLDTPNRNHAEHEAYLFKQAKDRNDLFKKYLILKKNHPESVASFLDCVHAAYGFDTSEW